MSARNAILDRLRKALDGTTPLEDDYNSETVTAPWRYAADERIPRLRQLMEAVHTETTLSTREGWPAVVANYLREINARNLLVAPATDHGRQLLDYWKDGADLPPLKHYDRPIEAWKAELFNDTDASLTGTLGAIAATGSLVLWPTPEEPRLMSLVPPVHIALLKASEILDNFHDLQQRQSWAQSMPTNALLISGPSKTADIEQVLAYGAHGPKRLLVIILQDA